MKHFLEHYILNAFYYTALQYTLERAYKITKNGRYSPPQVVLNLTMMATELVTSNLIKERTVTENRRVQVYIASDLLRDGYDKLGDMAASFNKTLNIGNKNDPEYSLNRRTGLFNVFEDNTRLSSPTHFPIEEEEFEDFIPISLNNNN
jgi:hypothetical protein